VLRGIGRALLLGREPNEALKAFERVLQLTPASAASEEDVGTAFLESAQIERAATHLERALQLDPLLLSAGTALQAVYRKQGDDKKADALADRMRRTMLNLPKKSAQ
jgi:tetratricopeptide (TPR) repeat protein